MFIFNFNIELIGTFELSTKQKQTNKKSEIIPGAKNCMKTNIEVETRRSNYCL